MRNCREAKPRIPAINRLACAVSTLLLIAAPAHAFDFPKIGVPNLFGGETKDGPPPPPGATADCPEIFTDPGAAQIRVPAEADAASVRYQLGIRQTARECVLDGDKLTIKIGVEGAAMLGPLGQAGAYSGNVRVAIRDKFNDSIVTSKNYRVGATVGAGANHAMFTLIADPIILPKKSAKAQDDYEILVGFTQGGAENAEKPARQAARKRRR